MRSGSSRFPAGGVAALAVAALLTCSSVVSANAGSALMLTSTAHLILGNFVIGLVEGTLLARLCRVDSRRAVVRMILGNYGSVLVGRLLLHGAVEPMLRGLPGPAFAWTIHLLIFGTVALYALTVAVEWPFVAWALRGARGAAAPRALGWSALVNAASYLVLAVIYGRMGSLELFRNTQIQPDLAFVRPPIVDVFFIDPDTRELCRIRTDGAGRRSEAVLIRRKGVSPRLYWQRAADGHGFELAVNDSKGVPGDVLLTGAAGDGLPTPATDVERDLLFLTHQQAAKSPDGIEPRWSAVCAFWGTPGVELFRNEVLQYSVGYETVFQSGFSVVCRAPVFLPSGQLLFQLGRDLVILDPDTRKLGFLARGLGPAILPPDGAVTRPVREPLHP